MILLSSFRSDCRHRYYSNYFLQYVTILSILIHSSICILFVDAFQIHKVQTNADIIELADIRYNEWIATLKNTNTNERIPSLNAFRMATIEIFNERNEEGAIVFLCKTNDKKTSIGAAELSPIELHNCYSIIEKMSSSSSSSSDDNDDDESQLQQQTQQQQQQLPPFLYVTDVVTVRAYRRMGVALELMKAIEDHAKQIGIKQLLLHVKQDNIPALNFYKKPILGYQEQQQQQQEPTSPSSSSSSSFVLDQEQLEINAGTKGQLLLVKYL